MRYLPYQKVSIKISKIPSSPYYRKLLYQDEQQRSICSLSVSDLITIQFLYQYENNSTCSFKQVTSIRKLLNSCFQTLTLKALLFQSAKAQDLFKLLIMNIHIKYYPYFVQHTTHRKVFYSLCKQHISKNFSIYLLYYFLQLP